MTIEVIPDGITARVGWRAWNVRSGRLVSQFDGVEWEPGKPREASCQRRYSQPFYTRPYSGSQYDPKTHEYKVPLGVAQLTAQPSVWPDTALQAAPQLIVLHPVAWPECVDMYAHDDSPGDACGCGFHAATKIETARGYGEILGRVALWGKVVEHEQGYRGEYAYPQALYVPDHDFGRLKSQLAVYGVPVLKMSEIDGTEPTTEMVSPVVVPDKSRQPWWVWPTRLAVAGALTSVVAFQAGSVMSALVWAATGETFARQALGVVGAMAFIGVGAYNWSNAVKVWRWRRD